jgi:hypothetical protein
MGKKQLSFNEERVLDVLKGKTFIKGKKFEAQRKYSLDDIARRGFRHVRPLERANSWVRNALRGLVAAKLVRKVGRGTYAPTLKGAQTSTDSRRPTARKRNVPVKVVVRSAPATVQRAGAVIAHQPNGVTAPAVEAQA